MLAYDPHGVCYTTKAAAATWSLCRTAHVRHRYGITQLLLYKRMVKDIVHCFTSSVAEMHWDNDGMVLVIPSSA